MTIPDAAIGPIIAAIVAGTIAFLVSVLTKEQKTSEFRQQWIDALRSDISQYTAETTELMAYARFHQSLPDKDKIDFTSKHFEKVCNLRILKNRIILRLNRKEHQKIIGLIESYIQDIKQEAENQKNIPLMSQKEDVSSALLEESQLLLKREWSRVKSGESIYRSTKWASLTVMVVAIVLATISYYHNPTNFSLEAAQNLTK
jgi:hypothetical protein